MRCALHPLRPLFKLLPYRGCFYVSASLELGELVSCGLEDVSNSGALVGKQIRGAILRDDGSFALGSAAISSFFTEAERLRPSRGNLIATTGQFFHSFSTTPLPGLTSCSLAFGAVHNGPLYVP